MTVSSRTCRSARPIPLTERSPCAGREDEIRWRDLRRALVVIGQDLGELSGDWHGPRRAVGLGWAEHSMSVDLERELDFRFFQRFELASLPGPTEQLRKPCAGQGCGRKQRAVRLVSYAIVCSSSPPSKTLWRAPCDGFGFGRSADRRRETGFVPTQPSRPAAQRSIRLVTPTMITIVVSASPAARSCRTALPDRPARTQACVAGRRSAPGPSKHLRCVTESQSPVAGHALSACALRQELVADRTSRGDPTVDRSPPLLAASVFRTQSRRRRPRGGRCSARAASDEGPACSRHRHAHLLAALRCTPM